MSYQEDNRRSTQEVSFSLMSQEDTLRFSRGEVKYSETVHYRTRKAMPSGLFCYKIFGGSKRDACECGKYEGRKFRGITCSVCGVSVVSEIEKRGFFGHVNLVWPLVNWKILTNKTVRYLIGLNNVQLNNLMNFRKFLEVQPDKSYKFISTWVSDKKVLLGGAAVEYIIDNLPPVEDKVIDHMLSLLRRGEYGTEQWELVWSGWRFLKCGNQLSDAILKNVLVLPVSQRPIIFGDGGTYVSSQLNQTYLYLVSINNRLRRMIDSKALDLVIYPTYALLQKICNNLLWVPEVNKTQIKAIANYVKGKQGIIRQHLLGARINLSARAVIHADPNVPYGFCTIPYVILRDLFLNHAQDYLVQNGYCDDQYAALNFWLSSNLDVDLMQDVVNKLSLKIPIYINRNPTLHSLSFQCIYAIPIQGTSIGLHPNMCKAMGGDFDGDTVQVNGLLHKDTIVEARDRMLFKSVYNTSDGTLTLKPMKEVALGCYVLTNEPLEGTGLSLVNLSETDSLLETYHYRTPTKMFWQGGLIDTTLGRMKMFSTWLDVLMDVDSEVSHFLLTNSLTQGNVSKALEMLSYDRYTLQQIGLLCDKIKVLGNHYATLSGYSFDYSSLVRESNDDKGDFLGEWWNLSKQYEQGFMSAEDYKFLALQKWNSRLNQLSDKVKTNNLRTSHMDIISSGTRGSITSLVSMQEERGLVSINPNFMVPISSSLSVGLTEIENGVASCRLAELVTKAIGTREGGYFNRKMVEFLKDNVIVSRDCKVNKGYCLLLRKEKDRNFLFGRILLRDLSLPNQSIPKGTLLNWSLIKQVPIGTRVYVRTVLKCLEKVGVCANCYGSVIGDWGLPKLGDAVGMTAAHAMSEPITQMLMKTKHIRDIGLGGAKDLVTFYSMYDGTIEVAKGSLVRSNEGWMNVDPKSQVTLRVGDNLIELPYGSLLDLDLLGKRVEEGDKLYQVNNGVMLYSSIDGSLSSEGNVLEVTSSEGVTLKVTFDSKSFSINQVNNVKVGTPLLLVRRYVRNTSEFKKLTYMLGKSSQLIHHMLAEGESTITWDGEETLKLRTNKSTLSLNLEDRVVFLSSPYHQGDLISLGKDGRDVKRLSNVDQIIEDYHDRLRLLYEENNIKVSQVHFEMFIREFLIMCTLRRDKELVSINYAQSKGLDYTTVDRDINKPYEYKRMPLARLSYENVLKYLIESAIVGDRDKLNDFISNFLIGNHFGQLNFDKLGNDNP